MWVALAVASLLLHLVVHEGAHALALRRLGGDIKEAGLGLPFPPRVRVKVPTRRPDRRPLLVSISPWLIGAYVVPDEHSEELVEQVRYRDRAWFLGAGVVANLLLTIGSLAVIAALNGAWVSTAAVAAAGWLLWVGRKLVTAYMPVLGAAAAVLIVALAVQSFGQRAGPVGTAQLLARADDLQSVMVMSAAIGLSLALFNAMPVYPFDGGRITDTVLRGRFGEKVSDRFRNLTGGVALTFILYTLVADWL